MTKRYILLAVFSVLLLLGGCTKRPEQDDTEETKETLKIWTYYETDAQKAGMDWLVNGFNREQDTYEAVWEYVPMTEFTKKLAMAYTEEGLPDLAILDNPNMATCIQMGMCEDITDFANILKVKETYYPSTLAPVIYEEKIYGIPVTCNNVALIYNKEMLEEKGIAPPKTWEELEKAAAELTTDTTKGFLLSAIEGEQGAFQLLPWILSAGEEVDGIGGEKTEQAFCYLEGLIEKGYMTENCINMSQTDVARTFIRKETAMMENGPWILPMLQEAGINYGICKLPSSQKNSVIVGGEDLAIMRGKNTEGAKSFLAYYNKDEVMNTFCKMTSGIAAKRQLAEKEEQDELEIFREQMEDAVVRSSIPAWNKLSKALPEAFFKMAAGEKSPEQAARSLKVEN